MSTDHDRPDPQPSASAPAASTTCCGSRGTIAFFLILAAGVGLLAFVFYLRPAWLGKDPDLGPPLGSLSLTPVSSKDGPLSLADLKGKVVLLNFWGTWCPPCVHEFPDILALEKEYRQRNDFRVLAVSCGQGTDDEKGTAEVRLLTQAFLEQRFVEMPVYVDPDEKTRNAIREVADQRVMQMQAFPTTLLLDREHRIKVVWVGAQSKETFATQIEKLLNEE